MPSLKRNDDHVCPFCQYSAVRKHMKTHLTTLAQKGVRCTGLQMVISVDIWVNEILPHYTKDMPFPDLSSYRKETPKPRGRKRTKSMEDMDNSARRKRLSSDGLLAVEKKPIYTRAQILEMLRTVDDSDGRSCAILCDVETLTR